jgi:hypothetical protein
VMHRDRFRKAIIDGEECFEAHAEEPCGVCEDPRVCGADVLPSVLRVRPPEWLRRPIVLDASDSMTQVLSGGLGVLHELKTGWQKKPLLCRPATPLGATDRRPVVRRPALRIPLRIRTRDLASIR